MCVRTYCMAHTRTEPQGICMFQDTGQEKHQGQQRLHTEFGCYTWERKRERYMHTDKARLLVQFIQYQSDIRHVNRMYSFNMHDKNEWSLKYHFHQMKEKRYFYSTISMKLKDSKCRLPKEPRNACCCSNVILM